MFTHKPITLALGVALLFLLACDNQRTTRSDTTEVTYTLDRHEPSPMFWDYAASTTMLQTELGKLASEKTQDSMILIFADSALVIHSKALQSLRKIAEKYKHIQLPPARSVAILHRSRYSKRRGGTIVWALAPEFRCFAGHPEKQVALQACYLPGFRFFVAVLYRVQVIIV